MVFGRRADVDVPGWVVSSLAGSYVFSPFEVHTLDRDGFAEVA